MIVLYTTDFENGGALPAGWPSSTGFAIDTAQAHSPTHELAITANGLTTLAGPGATDVSLGSTTPGDMKAAVWFWLSDAAIASSVFCGICLRMVAPDFSSTYYRFDGLSNDGPIIYYMNAFTPTALAEIVSSYSQGWYLFIAECKGALLTLQVQRESDNNWIQTDGSWSATQVDCLSVMDSNVPTGTASYCQVLYYASAFDSGDGVDDFTLWDLSSAPSGGPFVLNLSGNLTGNITGGMG